MSGEGYAHLNQFCAAGVHAAQERRRERERREALVDAGVDDERVLFPDEELAVEDVHFIDAAWLTDGLSSRPRRMQQQVRRARAKSDLSESAPC